MSWQVVRRAGKQPRKLAIVVGTALAAVVVVSAFLVGTGAAFTSTSSSPSDVFTAGSLRQVNGKDGSAILTASLMKPGDSVQGTVTITNAGDLGGTFTLATSNMTDAAGTNGGKLSDVLVLTILDQTTSTTIYTGPIKSVGSVGAGTYAAGAAHTYQFTVSFPDGGTPVNNTSGDNTFKSSTMSIQFDWTLVQS